MPPKSKKSEAKSVTSKDSSGNKKISSFFKPAKRCCSLQALVLSADCHMTFFLLLYYTRSHPEDDEPTTSTPPAKRAMDLSAAGESLPGSKSSTPPTPPVGEEGGGGGAGSPLLSPEQKERIAGNKLEAESKRLAASVGAEKLGLSWVKALLSEFKKPYIKEVIN